MCPCFSLTGLKNSEFVGIRSKKKSPKQTGTRKREWGVRVYFYTPFLLISEPRACHTPQKGR